jgi:hypothetical protein
VRHGPIGGCIRSPDKSLVAQKRFESIMRRVEFLAKEVANVAQRRKARPSLGAPMCRVFGRAVVSEQAVGK